MTVLISMEKQEELDRFLKEEQKKCLECKFKDVCKVKKYRFRRKQDAKTYRSGLKNPEMVA